MQDVLNHMSKGSQGLVLKSSKGKFHAEILDLSFLPDPSHRVEVGAKHIFSIVNDIKSHLCGCTKADALLLKKYWWYTTQNDRRKKELREASKVSLNTYLTIMTISVKSGASRQDNQKK